MRKHAFLLFGVVCICLGIGVGCPAPTPGDEKPSSQEASNPDGGNRRTLPAPIITITSPARGTMVTGTNAITITGELNIGGKDVKWLKVNGAAVPVEPNGQFKSSVNARWGVNTIVVEMLSRDGVPGYRAQSFIWSTKYLKMDGAPIEKAANARLNQAAIDDGDRATLNDLASILERVINALDVNALLPETLIEGEYKIPPIGPKVKYKVVKTGPIKIGQRSLTLKPRKGGLLLWAQLKDFEIPIKGTAAKYLNKSATIKAPAVTMNVDIGLSIKDGEIVFTIDKADLDVSKVEVIAFTGLFKFLNGLVTRMIRGTLKSRLESTLKTLLPGPIKAFLAGFKFQQDITLPDLLGGKTLKLDSTIDQLTFDAKGANLGLGVALTGSTQPDDAQLGTPLRSQWTVPFSDTDYAFGVALSYNLINQVFTAAWQSGTLAQDVTSFIIKEGEPVPLGAKSAKVTIEAKLPPLMFPGTTADIVRISIGDLKLRIDFEQADGTKGFAVVFLSATLRGKLKLTQNNSFSVELMTQPEFLAFDITEAKGFGIDEISPSELTDILKPMIPKVLNMLASSLLQQVPIPSFDLSVLGGKYGIPKNTILTLKKGVLSLPKDNILLTGDL